MSGTVTTSRLEADSGAFNTVSVGKLTVLSGLETAGTSVVNFNGASLLDATATPVNDGDITSKGYVDKRINPAAFFFTNTAWYTMDTGLRLKTYNNPANYASRNITPFTFNGVDYALFTRLDQVANARIIAVAPFSSILAPSVPPTSLPVLSQVSLTADNPVGAGIVIVGGTAYVFYPASITPGQVSVNSAPVPTQVLIKVTTSTDLLTWTAPTTVFASVSGALNQYWDIQACYCSANDQIYVALNYSINNGVLSNTILVTSNRAAGTLTLTSITGFSYGAGAALHTILYSQESDKLLVIWGRSRVGATHDTMESCVVSINRTTLEILHNRTLLVFPSSDISNINQGDQISRIMETRVWTNAAGLVCLLYWTVDFQQGPFGGYRMGTWNKGTLESFCLWQIAGCRHVSQL